MGFYSIGNAGDTSCDPASSLPAFSTTAMWRAWDLICIPILSTKYFDADSKLYYYGYRYLSPELGRWLQSVCVGQQWERDFYRR